MLPNAAEIQKLSSGQVYQALRGLTSRAALSEVGKSNVSECSCSLEGKLVQVRHHSKALTAGACWDSEVFQIPLHLAMPAVYTWAQLCFGDIRLPSGNKPVNKSAHRTQRAKP